MSYIPIPKPSFLDEQEFLGVKHDQKLWRSNDRKRYFTWDGLHGEIEVFNKQGYHMGSIDPTTELKRKGPVRGRRLDVK